MPVDPWEHDYVDNSASTEEWHSEPPARIRGAVGSDRLLFVAAVAAPVLTSLVLIPWRGRLDTADSALFLVVVIVAVASTGRRMAALVAAITAALAFDYFLTRPYYSFRISGHQDLITEVLLLVVGVAVGELAARGRNHRRDAVEGRRGGERMLEAAEHRGAHFGARGHDIADTLNLVRPCWQLS